MKFDPTIPFDSAQGRHQRRSIRLNPLPASPKSDEPQSDLGEVAFRPVGVGVFCRACDAASPGHFPNPYGYLSKPFGNLANYFGQVPFSRGHIPQGFGRLPNAFGDMPNLFGKVSEASGHIPNAFGNLPVVRKKMATITFEATVAGLFTRTSSSPSAF